MTPVGRITAPRTPGPRKPATRATLAVCVAVAAVCGSGYQSSLSGTTGQLAAAAPYSAVSAVVPTGWVGRELLATPTPGLQDFLVPGQPNSGIASEEARAADNGLQVTSVPSDGPARPGPGTLMSPLGTLSPSSPFGERINPLTGEAGEFHYGLDFAAPCGTSVHAADAGTVRAVGWHPWGGGNRVEIDHGNGLITTYNHLEGISVEAGATVEVSEILATVGSTGSSTGCHLHFETIRDGSHVDPRGWTLTPLNPASQVGTPDMTSYAPGGGASSNAVPWVIAMPHEVSHGTGDSRIEGVHGPAIVAAPAVPKPAAGSTPPRHSYPVAHDSKPTPRPAARPSEPKLSEQDKPQPGPSSQSPSSPSPSTAPTKQDEPAPSPSSAESEPENETTPPPIPDPEPTPQPEPSPAPEPAPDPALVCAEPETDQAIGSESGEDSIPEHGPRQDASPFPVPIPVPVTDDERVASDALTTPADGTTQTDGAIEEEAEDGDPAVPAPPCDGQVESGADSDGEMDDRDNHQDTVVAPVGEATSAKP